MTAAPQPPTTTAVPSTITVGVMPCGCGAIQGDICDCADSAAEADRLFAPQPRRRRRPAQLRAGGTQPASPVEHP